jgi:DNA-binding MarR family transcriptional regulator
LKIIFIDYDAVKMTSKRTELKAALLLALRDAAAQLGRLNQAVGGEIDLRAVDLECLDLIAREGPIGPSELATAAQLHPASLTKILDRLERSGLAERTRDPGDRRRVTVRAVPELGAELARLYRPMALAMDRICEEYTIEQLELLTGFLRQVKQAGQTSLPATNPGTTLRNRSE